jgi:dolichyl-phosphate beta-glucosyltransferase
MEKDIELSIVIACYNEARRIPATVHNLLSYLGQSVRSHEIIIVDDGSNDSTRTLVEDIAQAHQSVRLLSHFPNRGRGTSIREGVFASAGKIILETDADGSTNQEAIGRFLGYLREHPEVSAVFGSRNLAASRLVCGKSLVRWLLGSCFLYFAKIVFLCPSVTDFTLGFKMFRRAAALDVFAHQYDNHFVAEAEIVYVTALRGYRTVELPVLWADRGDSRVRVAYDSLRAFVGVAQILLRRMRGTYR